MRLLGTPDAKIHIVDVARLTGGRVAVLPAFDALQLVLGDLHAHVEREGLAPARLGRAVSNQAQAEAGIYLDRGLLEGACVGARCSLVAERVELTVSRSSRTYRGAVWGCLGIGLVVGLFGAPPMLPGTDPDLVLVAGLLLGLCVAVPLMVAVVRSHVLTRGRSGELAEKLDDAVQGWIGRFEEGGAASG